MVDAHNIPGGLEERQFTILQGMETDVAAGLIPCGCLEAFFLPTNR